MAAYVPDAGDIVWLQFDPQAGHEQADHRPALVLSPALYNARAGRCRTGAMPGVAGAHHTYTGEQLAVVTWATRTTRVPYHYRQAMHFCHARP